MKEKDDIITIDMLERTSCICEDIDGFQITITTEDEKIQNLKDEINLLEKEMTEEKMNECLNSIDSVEDNEEKSELKFRLRNIAQAIKASRKLEELELKIKNMDKSNIDSLIYLDKYCNSIKKGLRHWTDKAHRESLLERLGKMEKTLKEMKNAFSEEQILSQMEEISLKLKTFNMARKKEALELLSNIHRLKTLNENLKALYKKDLKEEIETANERVVDVIGKYREKDIVEYIINTLGFENYDASEVVKLYIKTYKDKKYSTIEEIKKDISDSISLIGIKKADDRMQVNEVIINQNYVEYINAGKNNREKIAEKVFGNKKSIKSLIDLENIIDEVISTSQAKANEIKNLEGAAIEERLTELVPELRDIDEETTEKIVENLKKDKKIKSVEDIEDKVRNLIEKEKNRLEYAETIITIPIEFD